MAKVYREQGWWEGNRTHLTGQACTYLTFEDRATRIIDVEPLLVPGLLQTADYCRALMAAFGVEVREIEGRIARRLGRQAVLTRLDPPRTEPAPWRRGHRGAGQGVVGSRHSSAPTTAEGRSPGPGVG